jgi:hypothetical protein
MRPLKLKMEDRASNNFEGIDYEPLRKTLTKSISNNKKGASRNQLAP